MFKRYLLIILICFLVICGLCVFAREKDSKVKIIYLYSNGCGYCTRSKPILEKTAKKYKVKLIKQNVYSEEGQQTAFQFRALYVPFVLLISDDKDYALEVPVRCVLNKSCIEEQVELFINNKS